jgi:hypothetical protein
MEPRRRLIRVGGVNLLTDRVPSTVEDVCLHLSQHLQRHQRKATVVIQPTVSFSGTLWSAFGIIAADVVETVVDHVAASGGHVVLDYPWDYFAEFE